MRQLSQKMHCSNVQEDGQPSGGSMGVANSTDGSAAENHAQ